MDVDRLLCRPMIMDRERQKSKAVCDAYVLAKEIALAAKKYESRHFDPVWLYEKVLVLPEPPDAKEQRAAARAFILAGHAILSCGRPELAGEVFEKAVLLLNHSKSSKLRSKAIAGVAVSWEQMGKPRAAERWTERALQQIEESQGQRARAKQERQLADTFEKLKQPKLPRRLRAPVDGGPRNKRRAHLSTVLKKS